MKKLVDRISVFMFVLVVSLVFSTHSNAEQPDTVVNSGTWENLNWTLYSSGTLTISGSGAMPSMNGITRAWRESMKISNQILDLIIENGITTVGDYCFSGCTNMRSISIPSSVTSIGRNSFSDCDSFTQITLPESVTSIGLGAFYDCSGLIEISIQENVTSIGNAAFQNCISLERISLPASLTNFDGSIFANCPKLISAGPSGSGCSIEYGWEDRIPANAFSDCTGLTDILLPSEVTSPPEPSSGSN